MTIVLDNETEHETVHETVEQPDDWRSQAACVGHFDTFFPDNEDERCNEATAKRICRWCPVIDECLQEAVTSSDPQLPGVYGGANRWERIELGALSPQQLDDVETLNRELGHTKSAKLRAHFEKTGPDREDLLGLHVAEISARWNVPRDAAQTWLDQHGIKGRNRRRSPQTEAVFSRLETGEWINKNELHHISGVACEPDDIETNRRHKGEPDDLVRRRLATAAVAGRTMPLSTGKPQTETKTIGDETYVRFRRRRG